MLPTVSNSKNPVIHVDPGIVPLAPQILHETWILCSKDCFHTDCKIWYSSQLLHILQITLPWLCWRMRAAARYEVTPCSFDYTSQCILLTGWLLQACGVYCVLLGVEQWLMLLVMGWLLCRFGLHYLVHLCGCGWGLQCLGFILPGVCCCTPHHSWIFAGEVATLVCFLYTVTLYVLLSYLTSSQTGLDLCHHCSWSIVARGVSEIVSLWLLSNSGT